MASISGFVIFFLLVYVWTRWWKKYKWAISLEKSVIKTGTKFIGGAGKWLKKKR